MASDAFNKSMEVEIILIYTYGFYFKTSLSKSKNYTSYYLSTWGTIFFLISYIDNLFLYFWWRIINIYYENYLSINHIDLSILLQIRYLKNILGAIQKTESLIVCKKFLVGKYKWNKLFNFTKKSTYPTILWLLLVFCSNIITKW